MAVVVRKDGTQVPLKGFKIGGQAFGSTADQTESAVYSGGSSGGNAPSSSSRPQSRPSNFAAIVANADSSINSQSNSVNVTAAQARAVEARRAKAKAKTSPKAVKEAAKAKAKAEEAEAQATLNANKIAADAKASSTGQMPADQGFLGGLRSLLGLDDGEETSNAAQLTAQNLASKNFGKDYNNDGKVTYAEAARTQRESDEGYYKSTLEEPDRKFSMDPAVTALSPLAGVLQAVDNKLGLTDGISMAVKAGIFSNPQKGYDNLISKGVDEDVAMDYIQTSIANRGQRSDNAPEPSYVDPFADDPNMPNTPNAVDVPDPCPDGYVFDSEVKACVIQYEAPEDVFTFTNEPDTVTTSISGTVVPPPNSLADYNGPTSFLSPIKNPFV